MASSDIIKIGFDYRSSLAQFEKDTNGVFDGISSKAGKQKITIQLDAKDDKVIDKIKELQKLKLDKFTFEFGDSGLKEQLQTFDKLENKINEIINLSKGIGNSSTPIVDVNKSSKEIDKLESKLSELSKKYEELQKGNISGKDINLVDNDEFKKLSESFEKIKGEVDDLKTHMSLLDDNTISGESFIKLSSQVDGLSTKLDDLLGEYDKLAVAQKNLGAETNISSSLEDAFQGDEVEKASEAISNAVKEENNILEQNTQKAKENAEAKEKMANADKEVSNANFSKYDNRLESYNKKTSGYDATIARFEDGGWISDTYLKNVQAVKDAVAEYEKTLNNLKAHPELVTDKELNKLDEQEKLIKKNITAVQNMSAAEKGFTLLSGQKAMDKINSILKENSAMSKQAKNQIRAWYNEIASENPSKNLSQILGEVQKIVNAEAEAGRAGKSMMDSIKEKAWYGVASAIGTYFGFNDILRYGGEVVDIVTDLNTQITELAKVSEQSSKQIYADFDSYADIAKEVRGTISDTIAATADWSKNGYSIPDAKELAEVSQLYKNVGDGINIDEANESLISTLKGFKLEADQAEHIVDVFNEVSNNEAISSGGIGDALQRSAASFNAANTSLEQSVALVTATNSVLQDPEKVGNMWKTKIFTVLMYSNVHREYI